MIQENTTLSHENQIKKLEKKMQLYNCKHMFQFFHYSDPLVNIYFAFLFLFLHSKFNTLSKE